MSIFLEIPVLYRAKIWGTSHEDLSTSHCRRRKVAIEALSWSEMLSACYVGREGVNITRTLHDVTVSVHCLSCLLLHYAKLRENTGNCNI